MGITSHAVRSTIPIVRFARTHNAVRWCLGRRGRAPRPGVFPKRGCSIYAREQKVDDRTRFREYAIRDINVFSAAEQRSSYPMRGMAHALSSFCMPILG